MEQFGASPIDQRLFLRGDLLIERNMTLEALNIRPGDRLLLEVSNNTNFEYASELVLSVLHNGLITFRLMCPTKTRNQWLSTMLEVLQLTLITKSCTVFSTHCSMVVCLFCRFRVRFCRHRSAWKSIKTRLLYVSWKHCYQTQQHHTRIAPFVSSFVPTAFTHQHFVFKVLVFVHSTFKYTGSCRCFVQAFCCPSLSKTRPIYYCVTVFTASSFCVQAFFSYKTTRRLLFFGRQSNLRIPNVNEVAI